MDLYALKCFVNLAKTLHFGKAGELSNLSPSALSRAIMRIEDEVGKPLFIRDNRSVSLTRAGELFYRYAREALQSYHTFQDGLDSETEVMGGEIVIAASLSAAHALLPARLHAFRSAYPRVSAAVKITEDRTALTMVSDGDADIAIMVTLPDYVPKGVLLAHLGETPLVFIAPSLPCLVKDAVSRNPIDWEAVPLVLSESDLSRRRADAWFRGRNSRPKIAAYAHSCEETLTLVGLGCGVGIVPEILLSGGFMRPPVEILDVRPKLVGYNYGLAALKRRLQHPVVRAFWESATLENAVPRYG
jgi:LysR family positive regulator for ilvC